jgi:hypothetical protein
MSASLGPAIAPAPAPAPPGGGLTGKVLETFDAGGYTYLKLAKGEREVWAAISESTVEVGSEVTIGGAMLMENFESPSLGRTFPEIYFGSLVAGGGAPTTDPTAADEASDEGSDAGAEASGEAGEVTPSEADNGLTIGELYAARSDWAGEKVSVRGRVVKYNSGIMGRNWIHLEDGSGDEADGTNDLTVTTAAEASVGEVVLIEGTLVLDKDFGAGYSYAVLIEEASVSR